MRTEEAGSMASHISEAVSDGYIDRLTLPLFKFNDAKLTLLKQS